MTAPVPSCVPVDEHVPSYPCQSCTCQIRNKTECVLLELHWTVFLLLWYCRHIQSTSIIFAFQNLWRVSVVKHIFISGWQLRFVMVFQPTSVLGASLSPWSGNTKVAVGADPLVPRIRLLNGKKSSHPLEMRLLSKRLSFQALIKLVLNSSTSVEGLKNERSKFKINFHVSQSCR